MEKSEAATIIDDYVESITGGSIREKAAWHATEKAGVDMARLMMALGVAVGTLRALDSNERS